MFLVLNICPPLYESRALQYRPVPHENKLNHYGFIMLLIAANSVVVVAYGVLSFKVVLAYGVVTNNVVVSYDVLIRVAGYVCIVVAYWV